MATADELLSTIDTDKTLIIDKDLRTITIPSSVKNLGVESDDDVLRLKFSMPRMYGDVDLSDFSIYINYMNAKNTGDVYVVDDKTIADDTITFSWLVGRVALAYKGNVRFIVCMKKHDNDSNIIQEYNTTIASLPVLEGLETGETIVQQYPDIIEMLLSSSGTTDHSKLGNRDAADQHPISAITGLQEALTPLTGTTETLTPTQVYDAIKSGKSVVLQHTIPLFGLFIFASFNIFEGTKTVVSTSIAKNGNAYLVGSLVGPAASNEWVFNITEMAKADDIPVAVNNALAQAKESGEFDGADGLTPTIGDNGNWYLGATDTGKPSRGDKGDTGATGATGAAGAAGKSAYQYAVDGGYTGTEAEFAAKLVAEKFANPNALTFTGAVAGSYDGSAPVSVKIPSGGEKWETILDLTLEEDVNKVVLMSGDVGYKKILVYMESVPPTDQTVTSNQAVSIYSGETTMFEAIAKLTSAYLYNGNRLSGASIELTPYAANVFASGAAGWYDTGTPTEVKMGYSSKNSLSKPIKELTAQVWGNALFGVGSWFKVYGVRV